MRKQSTKSARMAPLQRLTVRPIEDPAQQAALDELLQRSDESVANVSAPKGRSRGAKNNAHRKGTEDRRSP